MLLGHCLTIHLKKVFMRKEKKKKPINVLGPVWYMCLKIKNCCLKIFMEICVGEKVR